MSDTPESQPESRTLMRRFRDAVQTPYVPSPPKHRMTLRSLQPAEELGPYSSSVDDVYQVPADLEPWVPGEGDEIPWELREDAPGA